eukprot:3753101-Heterocapsa_arctica.AAC.1
MSTAPRPQGDASMARRTTGPHAGATRNLRSSAPHSPTRKARSHNKVWRIRRTWIKHAGSRRFRRLAAAKAGSPPSPPAPLGASLSLSGAHKPARKGRSSTTKPATNETLPQYDRSRLRGITMRPMNSTVSASSSSIFRAGMRTTMRSGLA